MKAKVPISETGTAMIGMIVERTLPRKRKTTTMTSANASKRVVTTSSIDERTKVVASKAISYFIPSGNRLASSSNCSFTWLPR